MFFVKIHVHLSGLHASSLKHGKIWSSVPDVMGLLSSICQYISHEMYGNIAVYKTVYQFIVILDYFINIIIILNYYLILNYYY